MTVVFNQYCMLYLQPNRKKLPSLKLIVTAIVITLKLQSMQIITLPQVIVGDRPIPFITYEEHILVCPRHIVNEERSRAAKLEVPSTQYHGSATQS